jgi:flagellar biosynthesis regulator FlaF
MQSQSEIINTKVWNEEEIRDLILFAQSLRMENEELRAKIIAMDAYVKNGDAKVRQLQTILKRYTI